MTKTRTLVAAVVAIAAATILNPAAPARAQAVIDVTVCARPGSVTLPGLASPVDIWGFAPGSCATLAPATLPGPVIQASQGDTVNVTLEVATEMPGPVSFVVPNHAGRPDITGAAPGGTATYSFTGLAPGTYLYESGVDAARQVPMGLYGALVVSSDDALTVYGAGTGTDFDVQATLVISELDVQLNGNPSGFSLNNYAPEYFLINGEPYPATDPISVAAGDQLLLRYVNAGLQNHSLRTLGLHQRVVGRESRRVVNPHDVVAEMLAAGQVAETIATVPPDAAVGTSFALSSRNGRITNNLATGGGLFTSIQVVSAPPPPPPLSLSFDQPGVAPPVTFGDEDVVVRDTTFSLGLDGSAAGLPGTADIDALDVVGPGDFLMSFDAASTTVPGVGAVDDSDVVRYSSGTFSMYFDGSDVGLTVAAEDLDAIELLASPTRLLVSTLGDPTVSGLSSPVLRDEDILAFTPSAGGLGDDSTAGTWSLWFEGSDVGLSQADDGEDVDGAAMENGNLLLSTRGNVTVPGVSGQNEDVFVCGSLVTGPDTACTYSATLRFDGSALGVTATAGGDATNNVDGIG